jgi:hypothetical protein
MNTVNVFKDNNGKVIGTTTDPSVGVQISIDSPEFIAFLDKLNAPPVPTWDEIRQKRDRLIESSDWVMFSDVNVSNKEAWLTYRQALRDLPQSFEDPEEVVWPEKPE